MTSDVVKDYGDDRYFTRLATAFVRGKTREPMNDSSPDEVIKFGLSKGLRLHKFKRNADLPRVRKILGILQGLRPASLIDIGSGRGTFLWPLLEAFPHLEVTAIDIDPLRVADINAVHDGGIANVRAFQMDAANIDLKENYAEVVTALEVLEHLSSPKEVRLKRCAWQGILSLPRCRRKKMTTRSISISLTGRASSQYFFLPALAT